MQIVPTEIENCYVIKLNTINDNRGFFARSFCTKTFQKYGLCSNYTQQSIAYNSQANIIRGMHFQKAPYEEVKLVQVIQGNIYDVVLDLRPNSKTYLQWCSFELKSEKPEIVYIPKGCAHGYQSISEFSTILYSMSEAYQAEHYSGVRYNDIAFNIQWKNTQHVIISDKDRTLPDYKI